MGQLERRYGREDAARRILQLHAVWVSHMHADHHGGLYPLLLHRQYLQQQATCTAGTDSSNSSTQQQKPLLILGPWPLFRVLCEYAKVLQFQFRFIPNTYFYTPDPRPPPADCMKLYEAVKAAAGLKVLRPFPVEHVAHSTGLQLESLDGWKVVFSGRILETVQRVGACLALIVFDMQSACHTYVRFCTAVWVAGLPV